MLRDGRDGNPDRLADLSAGLLQPPELPHATDQSLGRPNWDRAWATGMGPEGHLLGEVGGESLSQWALRRLQPGQSEARAALVTTVLKSCFI